MRPRARTPMIHSWTGDEDIPSIEPAGAAVEDLVLAGGMPQDVIQQRGSRLEVRDGYTPGWRMIKTPRGQVRGDTPDEALRVGAVFLEEMEALLRASMGGRHVENFFVKLFKDSKDFRTVASLAGAANAESYYDPRVQEMVFWFGQYATHDLFQRAFAHEITHAYMDQAWGVTEPIWFAEGMAEYFSDLEWSGTQLLAGQVNPRALLLLGLDMLPLKDFLSLKRQDYYGVEFAYRYAQGWAFVHFLYNRAPDVIERLLRREDVDGLEDLDVPFRNYVERTLKPRGS